MLIAIGSFFIALVGLIALFALKRVEVRRGTVFLPEWRAKADERSLQLKSAGIGLWADITKFPPVALRTSRFLVHETALGIAAFARMAERGAHRLADLVSHKRGFERRETRSEFLRKVGEHKVQPNGDQGSLNV